MWLALPKRRVFGAIALLVGILGTLGVIYALVPGRDIPPAAESTPR